MIEGKSTKTLINLVLAGNWLVEQLNLFFKTYDLTVQQYNILRILRGQRGKPLNLFELQKHMIHKMSNTTRLVEKLKIKELVERNICESNRRKIEITITEKGLGLLDGIDNALLTYEDDLISNLTTNDCDKLNSLLEKLKNNKY